MSLEQKEFKKITSSNEKGIDKFKVDALFAFFIDKKEKKRRRSHLSYGKRQPHLFRHISSFPAFADNGFYHSPAGKRTCPQTRKADKRQKRKQNSELNA